MSIRERVPGRSLWDGDTSRDLRDEAKVGFAHRTCSTQPRALCPADTHTHQVISGCAQGGRRPRTQDERRGHRERKHAETSYYAPQGEAPSPAPGFSTRRGPNTEPGSAPQSSPTELVSAPRRAHARPDPAPQRPRRRAGFSTMDRNTPPSSAQSKNLSTTERARAQPEAQTKATPARGR